MLDSDKTKEQLVDELNALRQRVVELEAANARFVDIEKALKESEQEARLFHENELLSYQSLDEDGYLLEVNQTWLDTLGYSRDQVLGKWFGDFLTPGYQEHFKINFPRFKAAGEIHGVELEMVKNDGSRIIVALVGKIDHDQNGRFKKTRCVLQNITERKYSEENLQSTLNRFYWILSNLYGGVLLVNDDGVVEFANQALCDLFDLDESPQDLRGMKSPQIYKIAKVCVNPDQTIACILQMVAQNRPVKSEEIAIVRGRTYAIDFIPVVVHGKPYGRIWHVMDITDRKRGEMALAESHQKQTSILESISDAFLSLDENMVFTYFNKAAEKFLGKSKNEVLGRHLFEAFPEARGGVFEYNYIKALKDKIPVSFETYVEPMPYRNWYEVRVYPQAEGISVYFQVITERKMIERELLEARADLELKVLERTAELRETNDQLQKELTERKQAEDALRDSENRYRSLFQSLKDLINMHSGVLQNATASVGLRTLPDISKDLEMNYIETALRKTKGKVQPAAKLLGISRFSLMRQMAKLGIKGDDYK